MNIKEKVLKGINVGDEINITVLMFNQNISFNGILVEKREESLTIKQKDGSPEIPYCQIVEIKKVDEVCYETQEIKINNPIGYVILRKSYNKIFEIKNEDLYKGYNSSILVSLLEILKELISEVDKSYLGTIIINEIFNKVGDFSNAKYQLKDVKKDIKKNILRSSINIRDKIRIYKFCRNYFYLLQYGYVWDAFDTGNIEEIYPKIDPAWFEEEHSLRFLNLIRYYRGATKDYLLNTLDDLIYFVLSWISGLLRNDYNQLLIKRVSLSYYGLYEHLMFLRSGFITKELVLNCDDSIHYLTFTRVANEDLFIKILISSSITYENEDIDFPKKYCLSINGNFIQFGKVDDIEALYEDVQGNSDFKILVYSESSSVYSRILLLFQIGLLFSNSTVSDLNLNENWKKLNLSELAFIKDVDLNFFNALDNGRNFDSALIQGLFQKYVLLYNDLCQCYRTVYTPSFSIDESLKVNYVKRIFDTLSYNNLIKLFFDQELIQSILEFCNKFCVVYDLKRKCSFKERELTLISYYDSTPEMFKARSNYICRSFYEQCKKCGHLRSKYRGFPFYFGKKPEIGFIMNDDYISLSNHYLYFPISVINIGKYQDALIKSFDFNLRLSDDTSYCYDDIDYEGIRLIENTSINLGKSKNFIVSFLISDDFRYSYCLNGCIYIKFTYGYKNDYDFDLNRFKYGVKEKNVKFDFVFNPTDPSPITNVFKNFRSGSVISNEDMFFGRNEDLDFIISNLSVNNSEIISNRCYCIYGQTRTGKSSLLYHLKKRFRQSQNNVIVDLGDIGSLDVSDAAFRYTILSELSNEISFEHPNLEELFALENFTLDPDFDEIQKNPALYFDLYLKKFRRILDRHAPNTQIIILIDEFTYIYDWIKMRKVSDDFMKFWKGLIQNYRLSAIVVGQDHMMKFINDPRYTNCFGAVQTYEVTYLKPEYARQLVTVPVSEERCGENSCRFDPEAVDYFVGITAGSAYLLMNLCSDLIDYMNGMNAKYASLPHVEDFVRRHLPNVEERLFEPLFNDKMELDSEYSINENKRILTKIARATADRDSVKLEDLNISDSDRTRIDHLTARHVLQYDGGGYRIQVKLYAMWLRRMTEKEDA